MALYEIEKNSSGVPTGNYKYVAGRGRAEYGASTVRTGTYTIDEMAPGGALWKTFTFSDPMPDGDYMVDFSFPATASIYAQAYEKNAENVKVSFRNISTNDTFTNIVVNYTCYKLYTDTEYNAVLESGSCAHGTNEPFMAGRPIRTYLLGLDSSIKFATFTVDPTASTVTDKISTTEYFSYNCYKQGSSWRVVAINSNGNKMYIGDVSSSTQGITWTKLVAESDIFKIGDRRDIIGWADLSNADSIDGSSNYANNIGRIEGHNAIIQIRNPSTGYQWPVTNSGDNNNFMDFGGAIQFFTDKVNNHLYVRYANSTDMSSWENITAIKSGTITDTVNSNGYLNTTLPRSVNVISVIGQDNSQTARFVVSDDGVKYAIQILNGTSNTPVTSGTATVIYYYI